MSPVVSLSIKNDLKNKIDTVRGDVPRSRFIIRILETYVSNQKEIESKNTLLPVDYKPMTLQSPGNSH